MKLMHIELCHQFQSINFRLSNPAAKISWLINGQEVHSLSYSYLEKPTGTITVSNLTINPSNANVVKHQINVQCTAMNDHGTTSKQLIVPILCNSCFSLKFWIYKKFINNLNNLSK